MSKYKPPKYRGRPTKYKPEYCEKLFDHMALGLSFETFAVEIGVNVDTLYEWCKVHKDFSEAKKMAFSACQVYWEKMGRSAMRDRSFNSTMWIYNMKCRFRNADTWKPIKEEDATNNFNFTLNYDPKKLEVIDDGESN